MNNKKIEKKNDNTNMAVTKQIGNHTLHFPNLVPLVKHEYRRSMLNTLKNWFCNELFAAVKAEREYVKENPGTVIMMTQDKIDKLQSILDQCKTMYEIQALSNFVFLENTVPTDYEEVRQRGLRLARIYPLFIPEGK